MSIVYTRIMNDDNHHIPSKTFYLSLPPDISVEDIEGLEVKKLSSRQLVSLDGKKDKVFIKEIVVKNFDKWIISKIHLIKDYDTIDHLISARGWGIDIQGKALITIYGYKRTIPNEVIIGEFFNKLYQYVSITLNNHPNLIGGYVIIPFKKIKLSLINELKKRILIYLRQELSDSIEISIAKNKIYFEIEI